MLLKLLGELFCSQNVPAQCVRERERERESGEGKVSLCDEILKSLSLNFLTDLRRGSQSLLSQFPLPYLHKKMFDLPGFSWDSTHQKGALLSAAHEHEDVC